MITPEIAAFVVKEYLLPMFESDGKRLLAKKSKSRTRGGTEENIEGNSSLTQPIDELMSKDYNSLKLGDGGLSGKGISTLLGSGSGTTGGGNKTVFSELKLSQILL